MKLEKLLKYVNSLLRTHRFGVYDENTPTPKTPGYRTRKEISPQKPQPGGKYTICGMTIDTFWYVSSQAKKGSTIQTPNGKIIAPPEYRGQYHLNSKIVKPWHDPDIYTVLESGPFQLVNYTDENGVKKQIYTAVDMNDDDNVVLYTAWILTIYVSLCKRLAYDMENYVLKGKRIDAGHINAYYSSLQTLTSEWVPECIRNYVPEYYELFEISFIQEMYMLFENRDFEAAKIRWGEYMSTRPKNTLESPKKPSPPPVVEKIAPAGPVRARRKLLGDLTNDMSRLGL
jgi:hypothetical protein